MVHFVADLEALQKKLWPLPSVTEPVNETILPFVTVGALQVSVAW